MNTRLGLGLFLWEVFALALAVTLAVLVNVPGGSNWNADIFWGVLISVSFFGWAVFLLVTGFIDYTRRKSND